MKKVFLTIVAIFALGVYVNAQQTQTYNFSATVEQYIEVSPANLVVDIAPVEDDFHLILDPAVDGSGIFQGGMPWRASFPDNVYSNSPFSITYEGDPVLAREEVNGNGTDYLQTYLLIKNSINGNEYYPESGHENHFMEYHSGPDGASTGTYVIGKTVTFTNAPHDGEVRTEVFLIAVLPHKTPEFDVDNTWNQSADAGVYTAQVVATYAIVPWE